MESSTLLGSSSPQFQFSIQHLHKKPQNSHLPFTICCGLRKGTRKPLWRGMVMSTEAIQAVQALKLAKSSPSKDPSSRLTQVFSNRIGRLLKADLVAVLSELQRQNEWEIALQVFDFMRQEDSFRLDLSLYSNMILMLGKNKLIEMAEQIFFELRKEGLKPDTRVYTEMIGAYLNVEMVEKAMDVYKMMKELGCDPDRLTLTILIRCLDRAGEEELAHAVKGDCEKYIEYPERFLEEVEKAYPKRRPLKLV